MAQGQSKKTEKRYEIFHQAPRSRQTRPRCANHRPRIRGASNLHCDTHAEPHAQPHAQRSPAEPKHSPTHSTAPQPRRSSTASRTRSLFPRRNSGRGWSKAQMRSAAAGGSPGARKDRAVRGVTSGFTFWRPVSVERIRSCTWPRERRARGARRARRERGARRARQVESIRARQVKRERQVQ